ncbi:hypothetical protein NBRC116592_18160 [Colwellia sp. KU-HH00111]|uniref:hypothetical protein n=1 Tax=Colwellia sp. KU-HH00111 TaxID=3127652 RepID=UPI003109C755
MTHRPVRPLDKNAVKKANDAFYAAHPEMVDEQGSHIPLDPSSREHAAMRSEWIDLYEVSGGPQEEEEEEHEADSPIVPCRDFWIGFQFLCEDGEFPLAGVEITVIKPDGEDSLRTADKNGLIMLRGCAPGSYELETFLYERSLSDTFEHVGGYAAPAPVTASQATPPSQETRHEEDARRRGAANNNDHLPTADAETRRERALPWTPRTIAVVEQRKVQDGDSLVSLAEGAGLIWEDIADFNFGTHEQDEVNAQLRDLTGCTISDQRGNYSFSSTDDPGLIWIPKPFKAEGLATGKVHVFRARPIARPVKLEVQTVDDLGYRIGGIDLVLVQVNGAETAVTTDAEGYWSDTLVLRGVVDVYHADRTRAHFHRRGYTAADQKDGSEAGAVPAVFARLDPILARRTISEIHVPGRNGAEVVARHDTLRRRYGRLPVDMTAAREALKDLNVPAGESGGEMPSAAGDSDDPTGATPWREQRVAVDNVWMLGFNTSKPNYCNLEAFFKGLTGWLKDRHGTTGISARGFYVMALVRNELVVLRPDTSGGYVEEARVKFDLNEFQTHRNLSGAYAAFETGGSMAQFLDMETRSFSFGYQKEGVDGIIPLATCCADEGEAQKLRDVMNRMGDKVAVLYMLPHSDEIMLHQLLVGGTGLLEDYPADSALAARIHARNLKIVSKHGWLYQKVIDRYIDDIDDIKSHDELRKKGPPPEPFRFPSPAGVTHGRQQEIWEEHNVSSYRAWKKVNEVLGDLTDQHIGGSMFLRAKFEVAGWQGATGGKAGAKLSWSADLGSDGFISRSESAYEVDVGADAKTGTTKLGAHYKVEVNAETGEEKQTATVSLSRGGKSWGLEAASDGEVKVTGPGGISAGWNPRSAQLGVGVCLPLHDWMKTDKMKAAEGNVSGDKFNRKMEATLCIGIYFQLLRSEHVLAYLVRAPGFFESRAIPDIVASNWNGLSGFERAQMIAIGWKNEKNGEQWDRRLPADFPEATKKPYAQLEGHQKEAAVKLRFGLTGSPSWEAVWYGEQMAAKSLANRLKTGR